MKTKTSWTFRTAYAGAFDDEIYLSAAADICAANEPYTTLYTWSPELAKIEGFTDPWIYRSQNWLVTSVTGFFPKGTEDWWYCALSEEGDILFTGGGYRVEKIPGSGVKCSDAIGWGYLADLQQIGEHLYACGYAGQVYKRWGLNDWRHLDAGLLQKPTTPMGATIALAVINGPHENAIYAAGYQHSDGLPPKTFFYSSEQWSEIPLPESAGRIVNMFIESDSRIWMCGAEGTLLLGNARDGFQQVTPQNKQLLITSIAQFQGRLYLASNLGLFQFDPLRMDAGVERVLTDLSPELQDANIVDCCKNVLWSIGPKDIAYFDGTSWKRLHHPDNERIGV